MSAKKINYVWALTTPLQVKNSKTLQQEFINPSRIYFGYKTENGGCVLLPNNISNDEFMSLSPAEIQNNPNNVYYDKYDVSKMLFVFNNISDAEEKLASFS